MKKVIIIGATSGIGRELVKLYAASGALVGATGRREDLLYTLQLEYPNNILTECFDVTSQQNIAHLELLITKMNGVDLLVYNAGYGETSDMLDWEIDKKTVNTNVNGFLTLVNYMFNYFEHQGYGHIAATSSIASIRGSSRAPAYSASKAFMSNYMEGLYIKAKKRNVSGNAEKKIVITDIQPGFVRTKMAKGYGQFWVAPVKKAASQIFTALEHKKWRVYITHRWWLIAKLMKWMPDFIYNRIG
jgi:short-subunit dehydrogenase